MRIHMKRSLLLILCFFLSACFGSNRVNTGEDHGPIMDTSNMIYDVEAIEHANIAFKDMEYKRPDTAKLDEMIDKVSKNVSKKGKSKVVLSGYMEIMQASTELDTMSSLANIYHDMDLTDTHYETETQFLSDYYSTFDNKMTALTKAILESEYATDFTDAWGKEFIERYTDNAKLNSPEIEALTRKETKLVQDYQKALTAQYSAEYNGEIITYDQLDPEHEAYVDLFYVIYEQKNAACGAIFKELVDLRTQIADKLGYKSYTDYRYDVLGYGFTKEESAALQETVLEELVPLYQALQKDYGSGVREVANRNVISTTEGMPLLENALKNEFPQRMQDAFAYMKEHELYYFNDEANMMRSAFSTFLSSYRAPFLFINTSSHSDVSTLFHEFGHYANFYHSPSSMWNITQDLNLAEVHSQGLELLMHGYYNEWYGEDAGWMQYYSILDILGNILQGCAEDAFQQAVYANPNMSLDEINQTHSDIYAKYMGSEIYYQWVDISHNFEQPLYYISYATSALSALEIWSIAQEDRDQALKLYDSVSSYCFNINYLDVLEKAGLHNPFKSDVVTNIHNALSALTGYE